MTRDITERIERCEAGTNPGLFRFGWMVEAQAARRRRSGMGSRGAAETLTPVGHRSAAPEDDRRGLAWGRWVGAWVVGVVVMLVAVAALGVRAEGPWEVGVRAAAGAGVTLREVGRVGGLMGAVAVAGEGWVAGEGASLVVLDAPVDGRSAVRGRVPLAGVAADVAVADGVAYVAVGTAGLQVVRVAGEPGVVGVAATAGEARAVAVSGGRVYVGLAPNGLQVFDMTRPEAPVEVLRLATPGRAAAVVARPPYVYLADQDEGVCAADLTNMAEPGLVCPDMAGPTPTALAADERWLYVATTRGLRVMSLADPARPVEVGRFPESGFYTLYSVAVDAGRVFVGHYQSGVKEFGVDGSGRPTPVCPRCAAGYVDPSQANVVDVAARGGTVFVADGDALRVLAFDGGGAGGPRLVEARAGFTLASDVAVADGLAYVATRAHGLAVVDLRGPRLVVASTTYLGSEVAAPDARGVAVTDGWVAVAGGAAGLHVLRRDDAARPQLEMTLAIGEVSRVAAGGGRWYAAGGQRVHAVNAETWAVATTTDLGRIEALAADSDLVYLGGSGGLRVLAGGEGGALTTVGRYETAAPVVAVAAEGEYVAVGHGTEVEVLRRGRGDPVRVGSIVMGAAVVDVAVVGATLVAVDAAGVVEVVSLADPARPARVGAGRALRSPTAVAVGEGWVVVTDLTGGMLAWRLERGRVLLPLVGLSTN